VFDNLIKVISAFLFFKGGIFIHPGQRLRNRTKGYADKQDPHMMEQTGKALAAFIGLLAAIAVILPARVFNY
jgi:hypothetical protein